MASENTSEIKEFWNNNPVGSNFIAYEKNKEFYEKYDEFRYNTEAHILDELNSIDFKNKNVLEIGLGQGADSMQIIDRGALYYGIDITEESVKRVKERFQLFNKHFIDIKVGLAEEIPYPENNFDIIYSHGVIHHSPNIKKIVSEIHRVLKPGGKAVIMLYHKNSINYMLSIAIIRRVGLALLVPFPFLSKIASKLTGESEDRINRHKYYLKREGFSYFRMKNFIHRSTDGPDNVYASVWTKKTAKNLFKDFKNIQISVHFLNERHLLGLQYLFSKSKKQALSNKYGWHLWIKAIK